MSEAPNMPEPKYEAYSAARGYTCVHGTAHALADDLYTVEAMRAYGLQCAEAAVERERARCVAICGEVMREELERRQHYASSVAAICGLRISNPSFQIK